MTEVEVCQLRLDKRHRLNWQKTDDPYRGRPRSRKNEDVQKSETDTGAPEAKECTESSSE